MRNIGLKGHLSAPRRITPHISEKQLESDLQKYVSLVKTFGAADAKVIETKELVIDERVKMKCLIPICYRYGNSAFCPPNSPSVELMEKVIGKYKYGILIKHEVTPKRDFVNPGKGKIYLTRIAKHHRELMRLVAKLEIVAFNDGYYLAMGFGGGSCKAVLCKGAPCARLQGESCRFPLVARPSMESVGIDAFNIASKVGWEIYPIGPKDADPEQIPCALSVGLLLIC